MIDEMGTDVQMMESAGGAKRHLQLVKASDETRYRTRLEGVRRAHPGVRLSMEDPCNGIETAEATAWLLVHDIVFETDAEDRRKNIAKLRELCTRVATPFAENLLVSDEVPGCPHQSACMPSHLPGTLPLCGVLGATWRLAESEVGRTRAHSLAYCVI